MRLPDIEEERKNKYDAVEKAIVDWICDKDKLKLYERLNSVKALKSVTFNKPGEALNMWTRPPVDGCDCFAFGLHMERAVGDYGGNLVELNMLFAEGPVSGLFEEVLREETMYLGDTQFYVDREGDDYVEWFAFDTVVPVSIVLECGEYYVVVDGAEYNQIFTVEDFIELLDSLGVSIIN